MSSELPPPEGHADAPWGVPSGVHPSPLLVNDPPRVGDFWLDARLSASSSGITYLGHAPDSTPVMVVMLSKGAAGDAAARDRLAGEVNKLHIDTVVARGGQGQAEGRLGNRFRSEADDPVGPEDVALAPWVALAYDGSPSAIAEANRLLASVDLTTTRLLGSPSGPDYRLHWIENTAPGTSRVWPLPWPGRHDRAGWMTMLVSWLLMILLCALALLIAVLLFQNSPPQQPPPPVPTSPPPSQSESPPPSQSQSPPPSQSESPPPSSASPSSPPPSSASPSSGSPSPSSGSPSPSSGSPSPSSGSPSPGQSS
ncbi:MAG TPA: hypothetical protein VLR88_01255, partial [Propionibacteriaceae bacterium]|nr:hypothetical protein [Propionibacteriaceae bacterium]